MSPGEKPKLIFDNDVDGYQILGDSSSENDGEGCVKSAYEFSQSWGIRERSVFWERSIAVARDRIS